MILPKFLYDSALRGITPSWSGTTVSGFEIANATDWRDFSLFRANDGNADWTVTANTTIDSWAFYCKTFEGTGDNTLTLSYESSAGVFTQLSQSTVVGGKVRLLEFNEVTVLSGRRIRINVNVGTGNLDIRQLAVGQVVESEMGQFADLVNPTFTHGYKMTNTISQNGSVLNRSIKRVERSSQLNLENLTESWYRANIEPFAKHVVKYPFFYQPNPRDYPNECSFSVVEKMGQPKPTGKGDRISISWSLRNLSGDEHLVV